jgi:hypothetical protein
VEPSKYIYFLLAPDIKNRSLCLFCWSSVEPHFGLKLLSFVLPGMRIILVSLSEPSLENPSSAVWEHGVHPLQVKRHLGQNLQSTVTSSVTAPKLEALIRNFAQYSRGQASCLAQGWEVECTVTTAPPLDPMSQGQPWRPSTGWSHNK